MHLVMANQGGNTVLRDYRKGNWTVQETMVLIEAKKMDDERRMKRVGESTEGRTKPAELRWKWVEDYCWRNGCLRSQNQCNDKWDNLMRDFKKVRDYERKLGEGSSEGSSYWKIERNERKERSLPSNMLPQIYEALVGVVERKGGQRMVVGGSGGGGYSSNFQPSLPPPLQYSISNQVALLTLPPPPPPPPPPPSLPEPPPQSSAQPQPYSQPLPTPTMCDSSDSDTSEYSDSPAKRRRRGGEGTSGNASGDGPPNEVGSAISRSAAIIAEAIQASEEREERRHRDLLSLHERRLKIEESKTEITKQGINGLVDAINKLANSISSLASHKDQSTSK